jgi:hypothetical protein
MDREASTPKGAETAVIEGFQNVMEALVKTLKTGEGSTTPKTSWKHIVLPTQTMILRASSRLTEEDTDMDGNSMAGMVRTLPVQTLESILKANSTEAAHQLMRHELHKLNIKNVDLSIGTVTAIRAGVLIPSSEAPGGHYPMSVFAFGPNLGHDLATFQLQEQELMELHVASTEGKGYDQDGVAKQVKCRFAQVQMIHDINTVVDNYDGVLALLFGQESPLRT